MTSLATSRASRLDRLHEHLKAENEDLMHALEAYRGLDVIGHKMGLLEPSQSYANNISWWPLISVLGTFSAGKSSFINSYLGLKLQRTGNQAVDDRFTVIVYGRDGEVKTMPGQALDSDPRFPFFRISEAIEDVAPGEGRRVDRYLEMKAVPSEALRGKILIDSPGFDADDQRTATLRITQHIIGLSDLVLVFFDARHPEAGAMRDTLKHLVSEVVGKIDHEKFVYVLNQIDTSARENNLEDIVAAWRGSLTQHGLTAGRFYIDYNKDLAQPVEDKAVWAAYEAKRSQDHKQIQAHLDSVNVFRTYRIVGRIKLIANAIEERTVPALTAAYSDWRRYVLAADALMLAALGGAAFYWRELLQEQWLLAAAGGLVVMIAWHFLMRRQLAKLVAKRLKQEDETGNIRAAFVKSVAFWRPMFAGIKGWSFLGWRRVNKIRESAERLIEALNTRNTDPSGKRPQADSATAAPTVAAAGVAGAGPAEVRPSVVAAAKPAAAPVAAPANPAPASPAAASTAPAAKPAPVASTPAAGNSPAGMRPGLASVASEVRATPPAGAPGSPGAAAQKPAEAAAGSAQAAAPAATGPGGKS